MPVRAKSILLGAAISLAAAAVALAQSTESKEETKKLLDEADAIAEKVSRLRGLPIKRPIKRGVMSKEQITKRLLSRVNQEYQPDEIAGEELAMKRLGLLPPDADYLDMVIRLLTDQIAGFYDPWEQQLYIADWISLGRDAIMAHEIDHALQDQHFNLRKWMAADRKNADATIARQALVEGDGLALMIEFSSPMPVPWGQDGFINSVTSMMWLGMATLGDVPLVLKEVLVFPYLSGIQFVAELRKTRPWSAVDEVYRKPPLSSEHIMHPHTYAAYERPDEVRAATPAALKGHKQRYQNVLGQLGVSVLLRQHKVADTTARIAAAGWGGDRFAVYTPPGAPDRTGASATAVLYTTWDSEVDAVEFQAALADAMPSLTGGAESARRPDLVEYRAPIGALSSAERRADAVILVVGAPAASAAALRAQLWTAWSARRR
jgi:hypothetical protein